MSDYENIDKIKPHSKLSNTKAKIITEVLRGEVKIGWLRDVVDVSKQNLGNRLTNNSGAAQTVKKHVFDLLRYTGETYK